MNYKPHRYIGHIGTGLDYVPYVPMWLKNTVEPRRGSIGVLIFKISVILIPLKGP